MTTSYSRQSQSQTARRAAGGSPSVSLGVKLCSATGVVELSEAVLEEHVFGPAMAQIVTAAEEVKASGLGQGKKVTKASAVGGRCMHTRSTGFPPFVPCRHRG
mgnify:CR=1 FL=1